MSEKFWDKMAGAYDNAEKADTPVNLRVIEKTKRFLKRNDSVLDFGCGTGLIANELASNVKAIHAIDISSKMVEIAKKNSDDRKITNIEYLHATIFDERLRENSFDAVTAFYVLHLLEDTNLALQRIYSLLKPGGLFISATPCMAGKPFLNFLFKLTGKIGLTPKFTAFNISQLNDLIGNKFEILETEFLTQRGQQYFIVARKNS